jgi:hypothetical protein
VEGHAGSELRISTEGNRDAVNNAAGGTYIRSSACAECRSSGPICSRKLCSARDLVTSLADEIVNLHAEGVSDSHEHDERRIAVPAFDLLQRVLVDPSQLRHDAAG